MASMETLDSVVGLETVVLVSEALEPYILSLEAEQEVDGEIEVTALVVMKRQAGVLVAMPADILSEETLASGNTGDGDLLFGPSVVVEVPSVIMDNGQVSPTGGSISVVIVDCLVDILARMRPFSTGELIVYGFDEDSPFALPSPDALLTEAVKWLSTATMERVAYYTPDEEEAQEPGGPQVVPPLPVRRGRAPTVASGTAKEKAKPKRATTTSLAADIESLKQSIPNLIAQVGALQSRMDKDPQGQQIGGLARPLSSSLNVPKGAMTLGAAAKAIAAPPRTQTRGAPGILGSPLLTPGKPVEVQELEEEKQAALASSIPISDNALALAVLEQSKALTSLVSQISSASSDPMTDLLQGSSGSTRGSVGRRSPDGCPLPLLWS